MDKRNTIGKIHLTVCDYFNVDPLMTLTRTRKSEYRVPRQWTMFFAQEYFKCGVVRIGSYFNRDHATVTWAVKKYRDYRDKNESKDFEKLIEKINNLLKYY